MAAPPVAITPVNDGIEKYVAAQADGAASVIDTSLVNVTVSDAFAPTVRAVLKVCTLPNVADEKFQITLLVVVEQPV